jgi:hypothetical protein
MGWLFCNHEWKELSKTEFPSAFEMMRKEDLILQR